jgi:hypothetical protein
VDGLDKKNKIVYEFNGCKFHGCRKCYPNEVGVYNRTMEKLNILEAAGYKVVSISECDWNKTKAKLTPDARHAIEKQASDEHITLRDALYGGRTECAKTFVQCKDRKYLLTMFAVSIRRSMP